MRKGGSGRPEYWQCAAEAGGGDILAKARRVSLQSRSAIRTGCKSPNECRVQAEDRVKEAAEHLDHSFDRVPACDVQNGGEHPADQAVFRRDPDGDVLRKLLLQLLAASLFRASRSRCSEAPAMASASRISSRCGRTRARSLSNSRHGRQSTARYERDSAWNYHTSREFQLGPSAAKHAFIGTCRQPRWLDAQSVPYGLRRKLHEAAD